MKRLALAVGALLATVAATASAQIYYERPYAYDRYGARGSGDECWNPRAGHFEGVRPGEVQNDLDFSRCRPMGSRYNERRVYREWRDSRDMPDSVQECWSPRTGRYEEVNQSAPANDLDYSRCRRFYR